MEWAFRDSKTVQLERRPVCLRDEDRTRGHALVVMLASLCLIEVVIGGRPSYSQVPTPRDDVRRLFEAAAVAIPTGSPSPPPAQPQGKNSHNDEKRNKVNPLSGPGPNRDGGASVRRTGPTASIRSIRRDGIWRRRCGSGWIFSSKSFAANPNGIRAGAHRCDNGLHRRSGEYDGASGLMRPSYPHSALLFSRSMRSISRSCPMRDGVLRASSFPGMAGATRSDFTPASATGGGRRRQTPSAGQQ